MPAGRKRPLRFRGIQIGSPPNGGAGDPAEPWRDPQPSSSIIAATFRLYARFPLLFLVLALGVIAPYDTLVLITRGVGPLAPTGGVVYLMLATFLISPLISALHIHAVAEVRAGEEPRLGAVAARGLRVLPTAAATAIMATLGIALGFIALIIPGVILAFRWYVAVQAAAIEDEGWLPAMRRSRALTREVYLHLFGFGILVAIIARVPVVIGGAAVTGNDTSALAFAAGVLLDAFALSFGALATALLYYDLVDRRDVRVRDGAVDGAQVADGETGAVTPE